jgi:type VI secretion system protein ImpE
MTAQELWKDGRLAEAVEAQTSEVRAHPGDPERRYLLFALLGFAGDLERASRQLDALGVADEKLQGVSGIYRNLLASEAERRRVFAGEGRPVVPADAAASVGMRLDAILASGGANGDRVASLLQQAQDGEPPVRGTCDGRSFEGLADTDELLGSLLEIFAGGRYVLVPFDHLRRVEISEPKHVLDLLWAPAKILDADGTEADVHLPALYAGTHEAGSEAIRLGRGTEWYESGSTVRGRGQKVLSLTGGGAAEDDRALLAIRELTILPGSAGERG